MKHVDLENICRSRRMSASERNAYFLLNDPESSRWAWGYSWLAPLLIACSVASTLQRSLAEAPIHGRTFAVLETSFDVIFIFEAMMRFFASPNRATFWTDPYDAIDAVAGLPLVLRAAVGFTVESLDDDSISWATLLLLVPVLRLLKLLRRFERFRLILTALEQVAEALPSLLFSLMVLTLCSASLIYWLEPRNNIESLWRAIWLVVVTMSTVGYGDVSPTSTAGTFVVAVLVTCSVLYMAMPLSIVGQAFLDVWVDRDRVLLRRRLVDRLFHMGYGPEDILEIFRAFDADGSNSISLREFRTMIRSMRLGLNDRRTVDLFTLLSGGAQGDLALQDFLRVLFPNYYHYMLEQGLFDPVVQQSGSTATGRAFADLSDKPRSIASIGSTAIAGSTAITGVASESKVEALKSLMV